MISTLTIIDALYDLADSSGLKTAISGGLYKLKRPANSDKEDVVFNSLPVNTDTLKFAVANANIFIPDIKGFNESHPDTARAEVLAELGMETFHEKEIDGFQIYVQQQTLLEDEISKQHYINIRLEIYSTN